MKYGLILFCLLSITIICFGCSRQNETLPGVPLALHKMNQEIVLIPNPGGGDSSINGDMVDFQIKNLSNQAIIFPGNYGVKLFTKRNGKWAEVRNEMNFPDDEVILPISAKFLPGRIVTVIPYVPNLDKTITLRVVIIGHPENDSDQQIGAYVDINLLP